MSPGKGLHSVAHHPLCVLTNYTVVGTALSPASFVGLPVLSWERGQSAQVFLRHCAREAAGAEPLKSGPGPAVGAMEQAQTLLASGGAPAKPAAASVGRAPAWEHENALRCPTAAVLTKTNSPWELAQISGPPPRVGSMPARVLLAAERSPL